MDSETKKILTIKTVDKRETDGKSPRMETEGFRRAMSDLLQKGINVKEVVTDAHTGIGAVMSEYAIMAKALKRVLLLGFLTSVRLLSEENIFLTSNGFYFLKYTYIVV